MMVELNIPKSSEERVTRSWVDVILRQFRNGDLNINQTSEALIAYFARSQQTMTEIFDDHRAAVNHAAGRNAAGNDISGI